MDRNEIKGLNKVELLDNYREAIKKLKLLKGKLFFVKSLEGATIGVGTISIIDSLYKMYNENTLMSGFFLLVFGVANIASADINVDILDNVKNEIVLAKEDKESFEKEIKVRKFLKNRSI